MLDVNGLSTWIGAAQILHSIDLHLQPGEIACLLGANGAGKSTIMNTLAGLRQHRQGSIKLDGQPLDGLDAARRVQRGLALSPEGRQVFAPLSVKENLMMGAYSRHDARQIKADFAQVLERFPKLAQRLTQQAGTLSGGEQQMLAIGRALMSRPRLLLLDEPSLGLAPKIVAEIFDAIAQLRDQGVSVLLAEQNAYMALRISRRAYVLSEGRIVRHGNSAELAQDPAIQQAYLGV
ncbi:ABC transporter ATP-binding protein [Kerstersia similis]|uniref:ABC transporter ATP-binding protein n=1 Tax=Kerstersia similis TaxID=206505 RepID=UPI0039EF92CA